MNEVFDVQDRTHLNTHFRAISVSYTTRFINEHSHDRMTLRAGDFRVDKFKTVIDCGLLGQFSDAFCNRRLIHLLGRKLPTCATFRPKEKVGQNPPDNASDDPSKP